MTELPLSDTSLQKGFEFLANPPKIVYTYNIDEEINYHISMNNNFLSPQGESAKTQNLTADYVKANVGGLTPKSAVCTYTWKDINFKSDNWNNESVDKAWSFAKGQKFSNIITFPTAIIPNTECNKFNQNIKIGIDYSHFASLPTVNLLYMLSWDVIGFEEMVTCLSRCSKDFIEVGKFTEIHRIEDTCAYMGFGGCKDDSFFRNGKFEAAYLGLSTWKKHFGVLFEYRCLGNLEVKNAKQEANAAKQTGSSYFLGKILIDVNSGKLLRGDMLELVTSVIVNKDNKWIPQQKRRFVLLELI